MMDAGSISVLTQQLPSSFQCPPRNCAWPVLKERSEPISINASELLVTQLCLILKDLIPSIQFPFIDEGKVSAGPRLKVHRGRVNVTHANHLFMC